MKTVVDYHKNFLKTHLNMEGETKYTAHVPEDFNFAFDVVDYMGLHDPNRTALVWCNDKNEDCTFSYGQLKDYTNQVANLFVSYGVTKGDRVMLVLKRHYQFWLSILALHKIGAVAVPATDLLTTKDYEYRFEAAGISYVVATSEGSVCDFIEGAEESYSGLKGKFVAKGSKEGWVDFDLEMANHSTEFQRGETNRKDDMLLYFTSGTTGYPKMVVHSHMYAVAHIVTAKYWHNVEPDGLHLSISDTGWGKAAWGKLYGQMFLGAAVMVYDFSKFDPNQLLQVIKKYQVTSFCAPPTIYRFFIKEGGEDWNFSSVKYATTAGEALNDEVYTQFYKQTGLKLMEGFGQTETTLLIFNPVGTTPRPGSMGKPSGLYEICLVDEDGNEVPPGTVGEIVVGLPSQGEQAGLFDGYFNNPEETQKALKGQYYHTKDTAWMDEEGYYWYVGRTDDVIKASGYRIGPFEIESVLMKHPAVLECAVTGTPDPKGVRGTVVKATIVLTQKYKACTELTKEIQDFVKGQTAPYKYPRVLDFVEELPKTISGKIRRIEIKERETVNF